MKDEEQGVNIGFKEIYDKVLQTHEAVKLMDPRMKRAEDTADLALKIAQDADRRSRSTETLISRAWKWAATIASGVLIACVGTAFTKHLH